MYSCYASGITLLWLEEGKAARKGLLLYGKIFLDRQMIKIYIFVYIRVRIYECMYWNIQEVSELFSAEVQVVNILGFLGHIAPVTITHCNAKAFIDIS